MSMKKKIISLLSAVALALPLAGCNEETKTIGKINGTDINSGIYIYYTIEGYNDAYTQLSSDDATLTEDNIWDKKIDDVTVTDYVVEYATNQTKVVTATNEKFDELGLELTEDDEIALDRSLRNEWDTYGSKHTENGVSKKSIEQILISNYKQDLIFKHYYMADGIKPVPEKDILAEINKGYARVKMLPLSTLDDKYEPLEALEKAKVLEDAEEYVEKVNAGEDFDEMIDAFYKEKYPEESEDSEEDEELKENRNELVLYEGYEYVDAESVKKILELPVSDKATIVSGEKNFYVVVKLDIAEDEETIETLTDGTIYSLKREEFVDETLDWAGELTLEKNQEAFDRYNPKNVIKKVLKNI